MADSDSFSARLWVNRVYTFKCLVGANDSRIKRFMDVWRNTKRSQEKMHSERLKRLIEKVTRQLEKPADKKRVKEKKQKSLKLGRFP